MPQQFQLESPAWSACTSSIVLSKGGCMLIPRLVVSLVGPLYLVTGLVCAQSYPNKPVRVLTSTAGGATDFAARIIAQGLTGPLGQPVIVDNRAAIVSNEIVSKA